ncbi:MAG TPA: ester cyclase [Chitinophagales bacterium]|nr:ester cyclase [Chitinophagales bacterium]
MTPDQNKNLVQQMFTEVINGKNLDAAGKYIAPGFVNHGIPNATTGPDGFKEIVKQFTDGFPDMHVYQESLIAEGDTVVTRGYWTGTHKGNFMGIPGTGKQVRADYIDVWKIQNDKATENWVQMDMVGVMQQLGAMPAPSA